MRARIGNDLNLGHLGDSPEMLRFTAEQRATHLYVCGSTGTGKSKLLESLIRQDIVAHRKSKCGLLLIDPHGSLYDSLVRWLAWNKIDRPIVPIDLRQDDWVVAYNVLRQRPKADPAVLINNFVQAMAHVWGETGIQKTPLFARWASNVLWALYEKKQTLVEASLLMNHMDRRQRWALTEGLKHKPLAQEWSYANALTPADFDTQVSSTINRMRTFLSTQKLQQMFGQPTRSLDLSRSLEEGHIILVNLATEKNRVSEEDGSLFATLLLSDLWTAAKERGKGTDARQVKPFYVYADEFQNFVTPTMAKNLDQARGFGLHLTLANQFPRQILHVGSQGEQVYDSVMANARSKIVFETRGEDNLRPLAIDLFMATMSPDKVKHDLYSTKVMGYKEETRQIRSEGRSAGHSQGTHKGHAAGAGMGGTMGFRGDDTDGDPNSSSVSESQFAADSEASAEGTSEARSESVTEVPFMVPQFGKELSSRQFESIEDQVFRAMSVLHDQPQRHSLVRLVGAKTPSILRTQTIAKLPGSEQRTRDYLTGRYMRLPCAMRSSVAKKQLADRAENISAELGKAPKSEPTTAKRKIR
jgi:hypothetical protein